MHEVLVNRLEGLSLPRKSVVRLTDRPDMTLDVYHGRKTTIQQHDPSKLDFIAFKMCLILIRKCSVDTGVVNDVTCTLQSVITRVAIRFL